MTHLFAAQDEVEAGGLFQLFRAVYSFTQGGARAYYSVVSEQHAVMRRGRAFNRFGEVLRAGAKIRQHCERGYAHEVIGRERRQWVFGIETIEAGERHRIDRVQMYDRPHIISTFI